MNKTAIKWTDRTWNPVSGCQKISAGCKFCYAETIAEKFRGGPAFPNGFDLTYRPHKLTEPFSLKTPSRIFVNSMSDMFWDQISDDYRDQMMDVMEKTPQHQYQILTKRPDIMLAYASRRDFPSNVWAGVTVEHQAAADERLPLLLRVPARIRFLSVEPLLESVDLKLTPGTIHWVIGGGESGLQIKTEPGAKRALVQQVNGTWMPTPDGLGWMRSLRDQCVASGAAFFFKQWGGPKPESGGRLLDDRTWDEYPTVIEDRS